MPDFTQLFGGRLAEIFDEGDGENCSFCINSVLFSAFAKYYRIGDVSIYLL
jgi:hypothetical protein